jgi:transglutaminase-like putative cysteine protease
VFTVAAARPAYWRMTSLDTFNGTGWSLNNTFGGSGSRLSASSLPENGPSSSLQALYRITALSTIWLPAAYRPARITGASGWSWSPESATLITSKSTSDNMTYTVVSAVPAAGPAVLAAAPPPQGPGFDRYLQLPASLSPLVRRLAFEITANVSTPYTKALAIQNYLRGPLFHYSLTAPADDSPDALLNFLTVSREGFCQQFAASYAALARVVGLPTRVAVGFTEGTLEGDGLYHVLDADAHAWPEVYFQGVGWTAFEPTPGRGSPDPTAQADTGVRPAQAVLAPPTTTPSTVPSTSIPHASAPLTTPAPVVRHHHAGLAGWLRVILFLLMSSGVGALILATGAGTSWGLAAWLRRRRRRRARTAASRVQVAWAEARETLDVGGSASETPTEYARRAATVTALAPEGRVALDQLVATVSLSRYGPGGTSDAAADAAAAAAGSLSREVRRRLGWWLWAGRRSRPSSAVRALDPIDQDPIDPID